MLTPFSSPATAEEEAYRFLLDGIRMGQLKAGDRIVPEEIASQLGMSRMPVREAFRRLATQELLTIRPNRGAVVRGLSHEEAVEVFEMRAVLEGLAATAALHRIGPADIDELERRRDAMDRCAEDLSAWVTEHRDFHLYLCGLSARPRLVAQIAAARVHRAPYAAMAAVVVQAPAQPRGARGHHRRAAPQAARADRGRGQRARQQHAGHARETHAPLSTIGMNWIQSYGSLPGL